MKNKKIRILTALFAAMLCMAAFPLTAYAGGGETEPPAETTAPEPEQPANPNPVSLTPDGNLTLVDDIEGEQSEDKQFITVVTKSGNYFYIIIDRAGDKENVYFLNMVDETDLLALIEDVDTVPQTPTVTPPADPEPDPQPTTEPEPEPKRKGSAGGILIFLVVLAAVGGAFYYFKIRKPKQAAQGGSDLSELDELEFDDEDDGMIDMDTAVQEDSKE